MKEWHRQRVMNLPHPPFPVPPVTLGGRSERKRSEVKPGKNGREGGRGFKIYFFFSLSYSDLTDDKLNFIFSPSSICSVRDGSW